MQRHQRGKYQGDNFVRAVEHRVDLFTGDALSRQLDDVEEFDPIAFGVEIRP